MSDEELREAMIDKIEGDGLTTDDLIDFMALFCQIANEDEEIQGLIDEDEFRNCVFAFSIEGASDFTLVIEDQNFSVKEGAADEWDAQLIIGADDLVDLVTGNVDGQNLYMQKRLEAHGGLPRIIKFQDILEIVLEELELL